MNGNGWVRVHRTFLDWEWYSDSKMVHLFLHMLLKANHETKKWKGKKVEPGQFISGRYVLTQETGISEQTVRTCINRLKSTSELTTESTNKYTLFTLNNWKKYQSRNLPTSKLTNNQPTTNQQLTTNKNDKKEKEYMSIFDNARKLFPGSKRGLAIEYEYFKKGNANYPELIPLLEPAIRKEIAFKKRKTDEGTFCPSWKHFKTWINNKCWTEEHPIENEPTLTPMSPERGEKAVHTPGLKDYAKKMFDAGIVTMPLKKDKSPASSGSWNFLKDDSMTITWDRIEKLNWTAAEGIGYIGGVNSGNLFCIDIDMKNDPEKKIATKYKESLNRIEPKWMTQLLSQTTMNGGFHLIGRCESGVSTMNLAHGSNGVVLETKAQGGYFAGYPTPKYKILRGSFDKLHVFTAEEFEMMILLAKELDENPKVKPARMPNWEKSEGLKPGADYDNKTSPQQFLDEIIGDGFKRLRSSGQKVYLRRPGKDKGISATFNSPETPGKLYVFSSSTELPERTGLTPFSYLTHKQFKGDFKECARYLGNQGYGEQREYERPKTQKQKPKRAMSGLRFLSEMVDEHEEYAKKHKGMKLGFDFIDQVTGGLHDELFLLLAEPGSYKTTTLINMLDRYSTKNSGLFGFFSLEMSGNATFKRIAQMTTDISAKEYYKAIRQGNQEWQQAKAKLMKNRKLMICGESRITVSDIARLTKEAQERTGQKVSLIGIDYLDFILANERTALEKIESIMLSIKAEICDLGIPVVLLCQTKRDSDSKGVSLRDAKGGTAIEGTADYVLGLYKAENSIFCKWLKHRDLYNSAYAYKTGTINLGDNDEHYRIKSIQMCDDFIKGCKVGTKKANNLMFEAIKGNR